METRLQEAESVLGMIQSFPDHRVQSLLGDMAQDPKIRKVFDHVHQGPFGPGGKFRTLDSAPGPSSSSSMAINNVAESKAKTVASCGKLKPCIILTELS